MIDREWALAFAADWIESWNAHDMNRILSHYTDDFEMSTPQIVERLNKPEGKLVGKSAARGYWLRSLSLEPPLRFELIDVFIGLGEITLFYRNVVRRVVAETLFINDSGKVTRGFSQWSVKMLNDPAATSTHVAATI